MAITDLKAHLKSADPAQSVSRDVETDEVAERLASLEAEFRLLREECVRTRNLIEDREQKGRTLVEAYKSVIADFTDLFEAQRRESRKRDEAVRFLLSSVETRIKATLERGVSNDVMAEDTSSRWAGFRKKS